MRIFICHFQLTPPKQTRRIESWPIGKVKSKTFIVVNSFSESSLPPICAEIHYQSNTSNTNEVVIEQLTLYQNTA